MNLTGCHQVGTEERRISCLFGSISRSERVTTWKKKRTKRRRKENDGSDFDKLSRKGGNANDEGDWDLTGCLNEGMTGEGSVGGLFVLENKKEKQNSTENLKPS